MGRILPSIAIAVAMLVVTNNPVLSRESNLANRLPAAVSTDHLDPQQKRDLECMAMNIYHEARGTPFNNQLAVALVVMNRQRITGQTLCQVIHSPGQFTWTRRKSRRPSEPESWILAQRIAYMVMLDTELEDITQGATHFHERNVAPGWSRQGHRIVIGAHVFVRVPSYEQLAQDRD